MLDDKHDDAPLLSKQDDEISRRLVAARLGAKPLTDYPGQLPTTLRQAYAIQSASIARWPDEVAGWKVAMLPPAAREDLGAERLAGPIFRSTIQRVQPGTCTSIPIFHGGFAAVEAEFVIELGATVPPSTKEFSDSELIELVATFSAGVEVAGSPMAAINKLGPLCGISDFGNNAGLIVGPTIPDWDSRTLDSLTAKVTVDGVVVGDASADAIPGGPLQALRFLLGHLGRLGIEIPRGALIATGATTGVHDVQVTSSARIDYGETGCLSFSFEALTPKQ